MTQAAAVPILRYDGNDVATDFAFGQYFSTDDELVVIHKTTAGVVTIPVLDVDYVVTGEGTASSGSVEFPKAGSSYSTLASGSPAERLTILRQTDLDRLTNMSAGFFFEDLNAAGDKMQRQIQENAEKLSRCAQQTESNSDTVPTLEQVLTGAAALDITSLDTLATLLDAHVLLVNDGADKKVAASTILTYVQTNIPAKGSIEAVASTVDVTVLDGHAYFMIPPSMNGWKLSYANAGVITAGTTNPTTIDIYNVTQAVDMLSTAISIASAATVGTAGTVKTNGDEVVSTNDIGRIDVTTASATPPKGLVVPLEFTKP
jgi:hypothetical protein